MIILQVVHSQGTNPDSERSVIVYAAAEKRKQYGADEFYVMISQTITKESHVDFTEEELFPIASIEYEDTYKTGAYGSITLQMKDGSRKVICFEEIESGLML